MSVTYQKPNKKLNGQLLYNMYATEQYQAVATEQYQGNKEDSMDTRFFFP